MLRLITHSLSKYSLLIALVILFNNCILRDVPRDNALDTNGPGKIVHAGLQQWWKFNNDLNDSIGALNGVGTVSFGSDRFGNSTSAVSTTGINTIDINSLVYNSAPMTIEFWFNLPATAGTGTNVITRNANCLSGGGYKMIFSVSTFASMLGEFCTSDGATNQSFKDTTSFSIAPSYFDTWVHYVFQIDTTAITLWAGVNNQPMQMVSTIAPQAPETFFALDTAASPFSVRPQDSFIDDVRIYDHVLSTAEMNQNHTATEH